MLSKTAMLWLPLNQHKWVKPKVKDSDFAHHIQRNTCQLTSGSEKTFKTLSLSKKTNFTSKIKWKTLTMQHEVVQIISQGFCDKTGTWSI